MANWRRAAVVLAPSALWLVIKELGLEIVFGSAGDYLKENTGALGDFLAWRFSTLMMTLVLIAVAALITAYWEPLSTKLVGGFIGQEDENPRRRRAWPLGIGVTEIGGAVAAENVAEASPKPGRSLETVSEKAEFQAAGFVAGHRILEDGVELTLSFLASPPFMSKITCVIVEPDGTNTSVEGGSFPINIFIVNPDIKLRYPKDFPGDTRLRAGNYSVTWLSKSMISLSPFNRPNIIALDTFTVG